MKVNVQDILKDARSMTLAGMALVALWLTLLSAYQETVVNKLAVQHLTAYLQLKEVTLSGTDVLQFRMAPYAAVKRSGSAVPFVSEWPGIAEARTIPALAICKMPSSAVSKMVEGEIGECSPFLKQLSTPTGQAVTLSFELLEEISSSRVLGVYAIRSEPSELPYNDYRLVLMRRSVWAGGTFANQERRAGMVSSPGVGKLDHEWTVHHDQCFKKGYLDPIEFRKCFDVYVYLPTLKPNQRPPASPSASKASGDAQPFASANVPNLHQRSMMLYSGTVADSIEMEIDFGAESNAGRNPRYWSFSQRLLEAHLGHPPDISELDYSNIAVRRLINNYISTEGLTEVAGIKVTISRSPWVIAILLGMATCLLLGAWASLKNATGDDVNEDFGWLLMQHRSRHGLSSAAASVLLVTMASGILIWATYSTIAFAVEFRPQNIAPLCAISISILMFGIMNGLLVRRQYVLSAHAIHQCEGVAEPELKLSSVDTAGTASPPPGPPPSTQ